MQNISSTAFLPPCKIFRGCPSHGVRYLLALRGGVPYRRKLASKKIDRNICYIDVDVHVTPISEVDYSVSQLVAS